MIMPCWDGEEATVCVRGGVEGTSYSERSVVKKQLCVTKSRFDTERIPKVCGMLLCTIHVCAIAGHGQYFHAFWCPTAR